MRQVFQRAKNSVPCVIFFDELDSLCPRRSDTSEVSRVAVCGFSSFCHVFLSSSASARVVNQLLTEMDGLETRKQVFVHGSNQSTRYLLVYTYMYSNCVCTNYRSIVTIMSSVIGLLCSTCLAIRSFLKIFSDMIQIQLSCDLVDWPRCIHVMDLLCCMHKLFNAETITRVSEHFSCMKCVNIELAQLS